MAEISLCMIVKDEEASLARCLESVGDFADEIIIVDTGSTDRTAEIARKFTEHVYSFPWRDDFSAARNFAFGKGTREYLFWMDADDVIGAAALEKLMELKRRLDLGKPDVVMLKYVVGFDREGRPTFSFFRERLLKNCGRAVWRGRIHEAIVPFGQVWKEEIEIEHRKIKAGDPLRNLRIFQTMLAEGQRLDARELYYYGRELYYHKQGEEALKALTEFLERKEGWKEDKVDACRFAARCLLRQGEGTEALAMLLRGLEYDVPRPELCCELGGWFFERRRYAEAAFWYRTALRNRRAAGDSGFVEPELRGYVPCIQLCVCYDRMGKIGIAKRYNAMAERLKPGTEACRINRKYFAGLENRDKIKPGSYDKVKEKQEIGNANSISELF